MFLEFLYIDHHCCHKLAMSMNSQDLIILTAPPASGKTFWIESLKSAFNSSEILVISPLRALANECLEKWGDKIKVMTPEEYLNKKLSAEIVIFDEFHLFFYWGDEFRPRMWEAFFDVTMNAKLSFCLTATLSVEMQNEIKLFSCHFTQILWIDHGNRILKYVPAKYVKAPSRKWMLKQIENHFSDDVKLIFCKYRNEVFELEKKLSGLGFQCITCVGGESKMMSAKLKVNDRPDFIISTTVLSHGVNLPKIRTIYFTYSVENIDFWIQMVARGGRKGEQFQVLALERPYGISWNFFQNVFYVFLLTIKQKYMKIRHAF